ncbi:DNA/RNA non-specific endonuclease [Photorhabdus sp. UCH-936]|nr:DNA/RNA non-specific endonuclease [Photorhabdus antumapuensis]
MPKVGGSSGIIGLGIAGKKPKSQGTGNTEAKGASSTHNQQANQSGAATIEPQVVVLNSGKKGAWEKQLNKPKPNTIYHVDDNKTYKTDSLGRVHSVEAKLLLNANDRNGYQQCKAGKCGNPGDDGGHLIATIFNGPGEKLNIVPMDSNLNRGAWKKMENRWANALKEGKQINVKIEPVYSGNSQRPTSINVRYSINGSREKEETFINAPGGK